MFAFSSENWKRPDGGGLGADGAGAGGGVQVPRKLHGNGVRIRSSATSRRFAPSCAGMGARPSDAPRNNTRITLSVAFNYGGRWDIVQACRQAIAAGVAGRATSTRSARQLHGAGHAPDPDLFIRTGGEVRISNFLLWQAGVLGARTSPMPVARFRRGAELDAAHRRVSPAANGASARAERAASQRRRPTEADAMLKHGSSPRSCCSRSCCRRCSAPIGLAVRVADRWC